MDKLSRLLAHKNCKNVILREDTASGRFGFVIVNGRGDVLHRARGLTRILGNAFPVADHDSVDCPRCSGWDAAAQRNTTAAKKRRLAGYENLGSKKRARKYQRIGMLVPLKHRTASTDTTAASASSSSSSVARLPSRCDTSINDREHGIRVDNDLENFVLHANSFSRRLPAPDVCSVNVVAHLRNTLQLEPIAAQVPIFSPSLGFATCVDIFCVDASSRSKLYLIEIKSTRSRASASALNDCYMQAPTNAAGNLRGLPLSRYTNHQLQLWSMREALFLDCDTRVDGAFVLRTSPQGVDEYKMSAWFDGRARALRRRIKAVAKRGLSRAVRRAISDR